MAPSPIVNIHHRIRARVTANDPIKGTFTKP